ncbi:MAG: hypothetical protein L6Q35_15305, partial [Phycisphaerales bacterium]|nr:hypothetical protein [Phycisphaerales bacterium]
MPPSQLIFSARFVSSRSLRTAALLVACASAALGPVSCKKSENPSASQKPGATGAATPGAPASSDAAAKAPSTPASAPSASTTTAPATPATTAAPGAAQPAPAATPLPAGWYAVYSGPGLSGNSEVRTWAPYAAFSIPAGQAIDPTIRESGWTAAFSGMVDIEEPGKYRFFVETEGGKAT